MTRVVLIKEFTTDYGYTYPESATLEVSGAMLQKLVEGKYVAIVEPPVKNKKHKP